MKKQRKYFWGALICSIAILLGFSGCDILREALESGALDTDDPNSEDYRPRFVVGIFAIVQYPRASNLEKAVTTLDGRELYINTNQAFSSKYLMDARARVRPGNPELCDLRFKLSRLGKMQWQLLAGRFRDEQVAFVVDGKVICTFSPEPAADEEADWVFLRVGIDHYHAKNIVKYAKKNYVHYNPDSSNFFKSFK